MDAILQFLIDWGYWGLFLGSFIAGSVLPFSSEAVLAACVGFHTILYGCISGAGLRPVAGTNL